MTGDIIPYLLQKRYATEAQISEALRSSLSFKKALLAHGVTQAQIEEAWASELGTNFASEGLIYYIELAKKRGQPFVDLSKFRPEESAYSTIPDCVARRHNVIPIKKQDNVLYVAMADTNDLQAADDLRLMSRCQVKGVIADPEQIRAAIETYYGRTI